MKKFSFLCALAAFFGSVTVCGAVTTGDFYQAPKLPQQRIVPFQERIPGWVSSWERARKLAEEGDYKSALKLYDFLLDQKGDVALARWEKAVILLARHEFDKAASILEMLVEEFPQRVDFLNGLGYAMLETGRLDRALDFFGKAQHIEPHNLISLVGLSNCLLNLQRWSEVLPVLEQLYTQRPDDLEVCESLVKVYLHLEQYEKARPLAIQLANGKNATPSHLKAAAQILSALGQSKEAERYWNRLLDKSPADESAHLWLADRLESKGSCDKSLEHLLFLLDKHQDNPENLVRVGNCYLQIREPEKALSYFRRYLEFFPHDKEVTEKLIFIFSSLGDEIRTLTALEHYFQLVADPSPMHLKHAAQLYDKFGQYQDAIPIYRKLLINNPENIGLLDSLARDLLATGNEEETLTIWSKLASISPASAKVYHQMLDLLVKLDRPNELHDVLQQLHRLEPNNLDITLRLVSSLIAKGEIAKGESLFQNVADKNLQKADDYEIRAGIFQALGMEEHALRDYKTLLAIHPERKKLRLKSLELAAGLGKLEQAHQHYRFLEMSSLTKKELLGIANAFRDGYDFETAHSIYRDILRNDKTDKTLLCQANIELAISCEMQNLFYEAEQYLRTAYLYDTSQRDDIMARLVDLKLRNGFSDEADLWLSQMRTLDSSARQNKEGKEGNQLRKLLSSRQFNVEEKYSAAVRAARELQKQIKSLDTKYTYQGMAILELATLELARALWKTKEIEQAEQECLSLLSGERVNFPALLLLKNIYLSQDNAEAAKKLDERIKALAGMDLSRMLMLIGLFHQEGDIQQMEQTASNARRMAQDSFRAAFCLAEAYNQSGKHVQARNLINALQREYPENLALHAFAARVAFDMGFNQEALSYCDSVLAVYPDRADMQLLKARVYWRKLDWKNSFKIYQEYLTPSVTAQLVQRAMDAGVQLPVEPQPTLWQRLTLTRSHNGQYIDNVMSPIKLTSEADKQLNEVALPLFSRYMWQQRFAEEMDARRLVEQRDDFQAVNQFNKLVKKYPQDESLLFDLAGLYSRLGKLGDEARLYARLADMDSDYPGLEEATERNSLKRMPKASLSYHYQEENGWNGYKAIRKDSVNFGSWASVKTGADIDMSLSRIKYSDVDSDKNIMANRAVISYDTNILDRLEFRIDGGLETADGKFDDAQIIKCGLTGKVGDRVQGEFTYVRDIVDDTLASLTRNIVFENYKGGLFLGILPRLLTGGDYGYTNYSDGNEVKGYSIWASYIIFPEPTYLQFKFKYEFLDARESGNMGGILLDDGFSAFDHPYWAPSNYWKNSYNILWKHKLSADTLERGTPSYYSAEFMLDYDSQGHIIQTIKGGFFWELTKNFMLESAIRLVNSDEYRDRDFILSALWRW